MAREQEFVTLLHDRLDALRDRAEGAVRGSLGQPVHSRQARLERDVTVAEQSDRLAALNAVEDGLCFGRIDLRDGAHHHIGRLGIRDEDEARTPLLIDWRAPVARPFYLATGHTPMGLRRRRHLTTRDREVTALHDEILDLDETAPALRTGYEDPNGDAVLLAAVNATRTGRMTDIVRTIQAEQDRIIRAPHRGVLVVEGGPGTGKTAVALHRAAYLLYAHREQLARRAVLIVGPNPAFLGYIGNVLPSLGETGVLLATPDELFPGVRATGADTPRAAAVKGAARMAEVLRAVVADRQALPARSVPIAHDHGTLLLDRDTVLRVRTEARGTGLPHNLARRPFASGIVDALTRQLADRIGEDPLGGPNLLDPSDVEQLREEVADNPEVRAAIDGLWPRLTPERLLAAFLASPSHLPPGEAESIRRAGTDPTGLTDRTEWTPADIPLLDEAAELLGEDDSARRAAEEAERRRHIAYAQGVLDLSTGSRSTDFEDEDDAEILSVHDIIDAERFAERQREVDHRSAAERAAADRTWAFGHIIVDEAQELSAMAWRLLMRRCPTRSMTLVGDPAQTGSAAGADSWAEILGPYVGDRWQHTRLDVNYRTPKEIMEAAAEVRRESDPAFEPPRSVRATGVRPWTLTVEPEKLVRVAAEAVAREARGDGKVAVIAPPELHPELAEALPAASYGTEPDLAAPVVILDARQSKGLEFDSVVVVAPERIRTGSPRGVNDLYVALTRATQRLGLIGFGPAVPETEG
ncbi:UvrD-helicase domain-containing protein [Streptomyces sp. AM 2-1-1]|uniref:HelD family protein n=1 Tax=Streptomyces sp. AM 2-1-1 TaxID=3028709 RepID=UPI0023B9EBFD|nr:UvrD-helicase domain-containing protein [Streptomyces sp. AM 2-1-1]WEH43828.1 AAA family ATPase [Streptomyces sp. AM 2-1-1]